MRQLSEKKQALILRRKSELINTDKRYATVISYGNILKLLRILLKMKYVSGEIRRSFVET